MSDKIELNNKEQILCPLCNLKYLSVMTVNEHKLYFCEDCTEDSQDYEYGGYLDNVKAFTEAIKDWI